MSPRDWTLRISDILDAVTAISDLPPLVPQLQHILDENR